MTTSDPAHSGKSSLSTFLSAGFRPFFLFAGLYGVAPVLAWVWAFVGDGGIPGWFAPSHWHGHEMIFGFVIAAASGFLLTAIPNWTNSPPFSGTPLALLALIWILGRLAMWFGWPLGSYFVAFIDLSMVPLLAFFIGKRLVAHKVRQNYIVLVILLVLFVANLLMHLETLGFYMDSAYFGLQLGVYAVIFLVTMISGRIIPGFTANALRRKGINAYTETPTNITKAVVVSLILAILIDLFGGDGQYARVASGIAAGLTALMLLIRMKRWKSLMVLDDPVVWVLHAGHFWLVIGFALLAAAHFSDGIERDAGLHALSSGAIGTMVMAMITRVALGHSGREIKASRPIVVSYFMVILGALLRIIAALAAAQLPGDSYSYLIAVAGFIWAGAFGVFTVVYWSILTRPRAVPD